ALGYWLWTKPQPVPAPPAAAVTPPPIAAPAPVPLPPLVRHEARPAVSPAILRRLRRPLSIPVSVEVDQNGHVTHARAKEIGADGLDRYLFDEALKCARRFAFEPGRPGPATVTIDFSPAR